jgi:hypothetical protein
MSYSSYKYDRHNSTRYTFISKGRMGAVMKVVEFTPTTIKNIVNLGFGDLRPDGSADDRANSNNNDIIKVMATIIEIVKDFTMEFPKAKIVFTGSSAVRTAMYQRMLKMYYHNFSNDFIITALIKEGSLYSEVPFELFDAKKYLAFLVRRKL